MPRNARQQARRTPVKASKRRDLDRDSDPCTSPDLSDDSGYSGVEDISDSDEDDEDHVYAAEEEHMIKQTVRKVALVPPRPREDVGDEADQEDVSDDDDNDDDDDVDDDDDDNDDHQHHHQDQDQQEPEEERFGGLFIDSSPGWEGLASDDDLTPDIQASDAPRDIVVQRHVRFAGVPDSDSDSTTSDLSDDANQFFPDIFVDQSSLDPAFRREVERDDEDSDDSVTFWDFHNTQDPWAESDNEALVQGGFEEDFTPHATPVASAAVTAISSPCSPVDLQHIDGYETDGDTTEEEIPEPIPRKKRIRRSTPVHVSSGSEGEKAVSGRRDRPRVGHFNLDDSERKPIAVLNPKTRKMMIFTPQKRRQFDLAPESFNLDLVNHASLIQSSPILTNPSSLMLSAMFSFNTLSDFLNSQPVGPAGAFFPCASDPVHAVEIDSDLVDEYYQDEEEDRLQLNDFVVGLGDSDSEAIGDEATTSPIKEPDDESAQDDLATPSRPRAISSASARSDTSVMHPLLSHFGNYSDAVGAFRRNQLTQQLISSAKVSQESLAFSGPLTYGTLRGIKHGSMSTVTSPLTPARKRKAKNALGGAREERTPSWDDHAGSILDSPSCVMSRKREGIDDEELFLADGKVAKRLRHDTSDHQFVDI